MKLPDFSLHIGLNGLREKMGADYVQVQGSDPEWQRFIFQLEQEGIDIPLTDVDVESDGSFSYRGQKVLVYIRDQHVRIIEKSGGYKFHLAQCRTLDDMRARGRYHRYVVTNRKDGKFVVNIVASDGVDEGKELSLDVCGNCTNELNLGKSRKFDLKQYFAKNDSKIKLMPKHSDYTAPINDYPPDWDVFSRGLREEANWACQECEQSFADAKEELHVHHIDGLKYNNAPSNLRVLCIQCHAKEPGHEHMKGLVASARGMSITVFERPKPVGVSNGSNNPYKR